MKDRLPTVTAHITLRFPQPGEEVIMVCQTLAEAQELYRQLGQIIVPVCDIFEDGDDSWTQP
jgi:hypothetical protein